MTAYSYPNLPSISNVASTYSANYSPQSNLSFVTATNPYCVPKGLKGFLKHGTSQCAGNNFEVQSEEKGTPGFTYEDYWCLGQDLFAYGISNDLAPSLVQTTNYDLGNYSPSYDASNFPQNGGWNGGSPGISYYNDKNGNNIYTGTIPVCPLIGGQQGTFSTTNVPSGAGPISDYIAQQNGNSWCQNTPAVTFNMPCVYSGSSQNIVNNWTLNDLYNYVGGGTYPLQPYPVTWPSNSSQPVFGNLTASTTTNNDYAPINFQNFDELISAGTEQLCGSTTTLCDPTQYNVTGVCPVLDSNQPVQGTTAKDLCQSSAGVGGYNSGNPTQQYANIMNNYCSGPNLLNTACQTWCTSSSDLANCKPALFSFCSDDTVASQNPQVCGCFRTSNFYSGISADLVKILTNAGYPPQNAEGATIQQCNYSPCFNLSQQYKTKYFTNCASSCIQAANIDVLGTVIANSLGIHQNADCYAFHNVTNSPGTNNSSPGINNDGTITDDLTPTPSSTPSSSTVPGSLTSTEFAPPTTTTPSTTSDADVAAAKRKRNIIIGASVAGGVTIIGILLWLFL